MTMLDEIAEEEPGLGSWAILHGYRGSVAHGMYEPPENPLSIDDKDTMAICVPPLDYYYGLSEYGSRGTREIKRGEWDVVIYEARKAVRMLAQGNPNILSLLWLPENLYIARTPAGQHLIDHRGIFVAEAARLFARAEDAHDRSTLPLRPDQERVEELCLHIVGATLEERRA
jgi:predicted nucleotidyltransferase